MERVPLTDIRPGARQRRWWSTRRGQVLAVVVCLALVVAVAVPLYSMSRMMGTATAGQAALAAAGPGSQVNVAIEVADTSMDALTATLLEPAAQNAYTRTSRVLRVDWNPATPIVMGRREDVRPGAIVQVRGLVVAADQLDAQQFVILSGFVAVR